MKTLYTSFTLFYVLNLISVACRATVWNVPVKEFEFVNNPSTVSVGDTIRWTWISGSHTTTSTSVPAGATAWNRPVNSLNTMFEYVITAAGSYSYACTPHSAAMNETFTAIGTTNHTSPTAMENIFAVKLENNDVVSVTYSVERATQVSIGLYDLTGKLLKASAKQMQNHGVYSYDVPIDDVKSGMYFVVVQIGDKRQTRKFTVR